MLASIGAIAGFIIGPGVSIPPGFEPLGLGLFVGAITWTLVRHAWPANPSGIAGRFDRWWHARTRQSKSLISVGSVLSLMGIVALLVSSATDGSQASDMLAIGIFAVGFAQMLYGVVVHGSNS